LRSRQTGVLGSIFSKSEIKRLAVMSLLYLSSYTRSISSFSVIVTRYPPSL
jgi:hypothetical protein